MNMPKGTGFSLQPHRWYACEIIGDEFDADKCSYSPIEIYKVVSIDSGPETFRLSFYHANYPEGVRDKVYTLKMVERGGSFILARSLDHDPARLLQIYEIDRNWVTRHFPNVDVDDDDIQRWLKNHS